MLDGLLGSVSGGAELVSAKDRKVEEQLEGNRYVGIQIAVRMDKQEKLKSNRDVFEGGPADRAGAKKDDLIEQVDGVATKGMESAKWSTGYAGTRGPRSRSRFGSRRGDSADDEDHPRSAPASDDHKCPQAGV